MIAVRRQDVTVIRLLLSHGSTFSDETHAKFPHGRGVASFACLSKTASVVAAETGNKDMISASVASGAWNDDAGTRTFDEPVTVDELIIAPS